MLRRALTADEIKTTSEHPVDFQTVLFEEASKPWPFQTSQQAGYRAPQDPSTMPRSKAPFFEARKASRAALGRSCTTTKQQESVDGQYWLEIAASPYGARTR